MSPSRACTGVCGGRRPIAADIGDTFTLRLTAVMLAAETGRNHGQRMSVMPPKAEVARRRRHFRFVPKAEVTNLDADVRYPPESRSPR